MIIRLCKDRGVWFWMDLDVSEAWWNSALPRVTGVRVPGQSQLSFPFSLLKPQLLRL